MTALPDHVATPNDGSALLGCWALVSCTMTLPGGSESLPYGAKPRGVILYSADGWMACQMANGDDIGKASDFFSAYHGRYNINTEQAVVTHHVVWSSTEGVSGEARRSYRIEGCNLILTAQTGGALVEVMWSKA